MQAALEKALAAQLRTALSKPIQEGFRTTFQTTLIPAFEGACQTMFSQVRLALLPCTKTMLCGSSVALMPK